MAFAGNIRNDNRYHKIRLQSSNSSKVKFKGMV